MAWLVRYLLYRHGVLSSDLQHRSWTEAGGMAHQLRMNAVLVEDLSWVFRTHVKWLTTVYDSRDLTPSFGLCGTCIYMQISPHRHTNIYII